MLGFRMFAIGVLIVFAGISMPHNCMAEENVTIIKVNVKKAKSIQPKEAGGKTVEIEVALTVKNEGPGIAGVSSRQYRYDLVPKGPDGEPGTPQMFFGIKDPNLSDAQPLDPGKSIELFAPLEGHTIGVEKGMKYRLIVTDQTDPQRSKSIDLDIK